MGGLGHRPAVYLAVTLLTALFLWCLLVSYAARDEHRTIIPRNTYVLGQSRKIYKYDRHMPLVFIGGVPRSGTNLMREILDAHPEVRCGQETEVIPRILQMRSQWLRSQKESFRLEEAGLSKDVLDSAIAAFCLEVIARHGDPAPRLCNEDPLILMSASYLSELFPQAKFILMIRDGRAIAHSIISRKVTVTGFDLTSYRQCLTKWNSVIHTMYNQCLDVGPSRCLTVHYEQLVLNPGERIRRILSFLDISWDESVIRHDELINKPGGVSLSKVERSSDQVMKSVNLKAVAKWIGNIPDDVVRDMTEIAPMLSVLGYDPEYGSTDPFVIDNTKRIRASVQLWENRA
ncbi:protein-tyrosine sulfotransferase-like [Zootermopsis nevadensis]|uniref:protein-tyrosine sulfotransferase-like n=1 Tax=Zootermopsis nevadensis TaxID=136037 RepID=UPI000B8EA102|nr:protein-tyrosine sulfotransferase-like [Zootermopsis nevadensis]